MATATVAAAAATAVLPGASNDPKAQLALLENESASLAARVCVLEDRLRACDGAGKERLKVQLRKELDQAGEELEEASRRSRRLREYLVLWRGDVAANLNREAVQEPVRF